MSQVSSKPTKYQVIRWITWVQYYTTVIQLRRSSSYTHRLGLYALLTNCHTTCVF